MQNTAKEKWKARYPGIQETGNWWLIPPAGVAIAAVCILALESLVGNRIPYELFFVVITFCSLFSGFRAGIFAAFLSALAVQFMFIEPRYTFAAGDVRDLTGSGLFLFAGAAISCLGYAAARNSLSMAVASENLLKESEGRLLQAERNCRIIADNTDSWEFWMDPSGVFLWNSPSCERISGYRAAEFQSDARLLHNIIFKDDRERFEEHYGKSADITKNCLDKDLVFRINHREGDVRWIQHICHRVYDVDGIYLGIRGCNRDITELRRAEKERRDFEAQVHRTQRLESIGVLAGGIAHDFNNLLAAVFGYVEAARMYMQSNAVDKADSALENVMEVFERAKELTSQLLTFSKGGTPIARIQDLSKLLNESVNFALSGSNVQAEVRLVDNLAPCKVDRNQIRQALDNIMINAKEAMPGGGLLSVVAENIRDRGFLPKTLPPGQYVRISVIDRGPGISPDVREHIFDPFFSTKGTRHGLGLSIAYSVVKKHGGMIDVETAPGQGSTFHIYLPASSEKTGVSPIPAPATARRRSKGRVLVMDDERVILDVVGTILEGLGYSPTLVSNGEEAIDLYRKSLAASRHYDAVILDLTVRGGLGGKDTVKALKQIDPNVVAIVASGYSADPVMENPDSYGFTAALIKPFQSKDLDDILRRVLADKPVHWLRAV